MTEVPKQSGAKSVDDVIAMLDEGKLISLLRSLIKIPSYIGEEEEKANFVQHHLERMGLEIVEMVLPTADCHGRRNVLGIERGTGPGRNVMLCAHLDTHWPSVNHFSAHEALVQDGKIYGIGTGDSLTPMAALLSAIDTVKRSGVAIKGDLIFAATVDELGHKQGGQMIAESGMKIDICLEGDVGSPYEVFICHTGKVEVEIRTKGSSGFIIGAFSERAGHQTVNAVVSMNKIINSLLEMKEQDPYFQVTHPLLNGTGAGLHIGPIIGGSVGFGLPTRPPGKGPGQHGVTIPLPTWCKLRVGGRYWPGQTAQGFVDAVTRWVDKAKAEDATIEAEIDVYLDNDITAWETSEDAEAVQLISAAVKHVHRQEPVMAGMIASLEVPFYARAGIDCVSYGCNTRVGSPDEHTTVKELIDLTKVYIAFIMKACT